MVNFKTIKTKTKSTVIKFPCDSSLITSPQVEDAEILNNATRKYLIRSFRGG
jgi:hypothetical protein